MHRPRVGTAWIARDRLSGYQRFEWSTPPQDYPASAPPLPEEPVLSQEPDITPSAETEALELRIRQLEREIEVREQAAFRKGQDEVHASLKKQTDEMLRNLRASIEEFNSRKQKIFDEADDSLVQLSLAIARRVIHRELTVSPEALHGLVRVAMDRIRAQELLRVLVHPSHEHLIRRALAGVTNSESIEIVPSDSLPPGGLKFETRHGYLDVSVDNQLSEIERGLADHLKRLR